MAAWRHARWRRDLGLLSVSCNILSAKWLEPLAVGIPIKMLLERAGVESKALFRLRRKFARNKPAGGRDGFTLALASHAPRAHVQRPLVARLRAVLPFRGPSSTSPRGRGQAQRVANAPGRLVPGALVQPRVARWRGERCETRELWPSKWLASRLRAANPRRIGA